jgi:hypothetical protein
MRIKVITKDNGEYTSDVIEDTTCNDALNVITAVAKGQASHLEFQYAGGKILFPEEILKTSVFIVLED